MFWSWQVEANKELKGVTSQGANVLPAQVIEDAFQNQYDKTLNYSDFKVAIQKLDSWYADRGIFGQVELLQYIFMHGFGNCPYSTWVTQLYHGYPHSHAALHSCSPNIAVMPKTNSSKRAQPALQVPSWLTCHHWHHCKINVLEHAAP